MIENKYKLYSSDKEKDMKKLNIKPELIDFMLDKLKEKGGCAIVNIGDKKYLVGFSQKDKMSMKGIQEAKNKHLKSLDAYNEVLKTGKSNQCQTLALQGNSRIYR